MTAIPYIILGCLLLLLYCAERRAATLRVRRMVQCVAYLALFLFVGLRGHLYSDFINYYPYFEDVPPLSRLTLRALSHFSFEAGFTLYTSAIKSLCDNYFFWVATGVAIDVVVLRSTFRRYCSSEVLPLLLFIAFQGLFIEFNLYRNVKALDLFLLSLPALQHRRIVPYVALNLVGAMFHLSSLVYLPLYFVLHRSMPKWMMWCGIVFANVVVVARLPVMEWLLGGVDAVALAEVAERVGAHARAGGGGYLLSVGHLERTLSIVLFTLLYARMVAQRASNAMFYNLLWLYYLSFMLCYEVRVLADRIPMLFVAGYWVLYANVVELRFRLRQWVVAIVVGLSFLKLYLSNDIAPARYDNLLFGIESYAKRRATMLRFLDDER